jgi:hypothetical protein
VEETGNCSAGLKQKRAQVMTAEGREVVLLGYMERACIGVHEHADGNMQGGMHSKKLVYQACGRSSREVNSGGGAVAALMGEGR